MQVLVIAPTFQEGANIERFLHDVHDAMPDADVLVVDDASPDGTADLAERIGRELGHVEVIRRQRSGGIGSAYRFAFAAAVDGDADVIVQLDADLSHTPAAIPALLAEIAKGCDLVIGSRFVAGGRIVNWSWRDRILSRVANRWTRMVLRLPVRDVTSGFRAYRRDALKAIDPSTTRAEGYSFGVEMTLRVAEHGLRIGEVPITFSDRAAGRSKMSVRTVVAAIGAVTWWSLTRRRRPHRR